MDSIPPLKRCTKCDREFPATSSYFTKEKRSKDGLNSRCKECRGFATLGKSVPRDGYKICSKCSKELLATQDNFYPHKTGKYGLSYLCKSCVSEYGKDRYTDPVKREKIQARYRSAEYRARENERRRTPEFREKRRLYKHTEKYREWEREYVKKKNEDESYRLRRASYRHTDGYRLKRRVWQSARIYRLEKAGSHTTADIELQYRSQKGKCWWCGKQVGKKFHIDHRIPIAKGGSNNPENLCISCPECNISKKDKLPP